MAQAAPSQTALVRRARRINRELARLYPDARIELNFTSPLELLVATILSAQTTDHRVNEVTPVLFVRYRTAAEYAAADQAELENLIEPTGYYRAKAKALISLGQALCGRFGGQVPDTLEELVTLPGVGRKTANVVLNVIFGEPTIAVDTHIFRVSNRTGIAPGKDVNAVEHKLMKLVPAEFRHDAHHWLILHGRYTCIARKPLCWNCSIADLCDYKSKTPLPEKGI